MMNAGLSALMPGQAAPNMAGVLPQPSQAAPNAVPSKVDALARLPFEQLQAMYRNPPRDVPLYAIISARDKQMKAEQMREAQQGLMAQQQVAGQRGTVADNVMGMDTVYAASGGEMRVQGYAGGNEVKQEAPFPGWENPLVDAAGLPRSPAGRAAIEERNRRLAAEYEERNRRAQSLAADREAAQRRMQESLVQSQMRNTGSAVNLPAQTVDALRQWNPVGRGAGETAAERAAREARELQTTVVPRPDFVQQAGSPAETAPVRDATGAQRTPPSSGAGLGAGADALAGAGRTPPPAATQQRQQPQVPAFDIDTLTRAIEQTGVIPPEILEERKALAAARKAQLERQQAAAQRYGAGLEESPEDRRMRAFAAIAEGLSSSPRLSKGLSAALSGLVKSETEARRARREGMKEVMTLEDAAANLQIAMQEQALADRTGDNKLKTAAAVAVAQAQQAYQKALFDQGIAAREVAAKEVAASNTGISRSSSTENTMLRERADALSKRIETLAKKADPLSPYSQAEKAAAQKQMEVLQAQLDRLLGLAPAAPTAASGSRIREVLVINPATGLLVPKPQP